MSFERVKHILDTSLADWEAANGQAPDLDDHSRPGHPPMSWATAQELRAAWGKGMPLIQPEVVGNGRGEEANLVIDLRTGVGTKPRMPRGGPYVTDPDIQVIVDWINAGCPDQ